MSQIIKPILKDETLRKTEGAVEKTAADLLGEIRDAIKDSTQADAIKLLGNEAVSGQPYHFPYHFTVNFDAGSNKIKGTLYTITLDNNKSLNQYPLEVQLPDAELKANKVTTITSAATDGEYPSAKAIYIYHDSTKQDKIEAGTANNIVAYSGTQGTVNSLNRVENITSSSTNSEIPTAKCVYDNIIVKSVNDSTEIGKLVTKIILNSSNGTLSTEKMIFNEFVRTAKIENENEAVAFHNSMPGGKDITTYLNDADDWDDAKAQFWKRLQGGTFNRSAAWIAAHPDEPTSVTFTLFEGLFPGDYIKMTEKIRSRQDNNGTAQTNEGTDYVMIAGFDTLWGNGDGTNNVTYHHIVCVPGKPDSTTMNAFGQHRMNATDTTNGGYRDTQLRTTVLGGIATSGKRFSVFNTATINEQLFAEFGTHLATTRELLTNAMQTTRVNRWGGANGGASGWEWVSVQACLMGEIEVYGSIAASSTAYDVGSAKTQYPVFKFFPIAINNRQSWYWLRGVGSYAGFVHCGNYGCADDATASSADGFVRPRFVLKA